ncbi:unnamed protein product [Candidula unifasciata]|uniref:Uncharacterized protein n=1 Tax=Candidula unifasciata TaxID=100452 RepID=A0A8S3YZ38_9EUPU|nr:unnamed protein product [Candidula unifasciata]
MDTEHRIALLLLAIVGVSGQVTGCENLATEKANVISNQNGTFTVTGGVEVEISKGRINLKIQNKMGTVQNGVIAHDRDTTGQQLCQSNQGGTGNSLCLVWENGPRLEMYNSNLPVSKNNSGIQCTTVNWTIPQGVDVTDTPEDCYTMDGNFWFGGFEEANQTWPMNYLQIGSLPFVTGDSYHHVGYGGVIEGIFISSSGVGIFVHETTPLYLRINDAGSNLICLKGKVGPDTPFFQVNQPFLIYDICRSSDITALWKGMSEAYLPKPQSYPSPDVLRHPIWSTWANYHASINQSTVMQFANDIKLYNFSISQLEVDDNWTPHYGDFIFNTNTFPEAKEMIASLTSLGIATTVWVHWFFNNDSDAFVELSNSGFLLKQYSSEQPLLVPWWDGSYAGVLDFTNTDAVAWYLNKVANLKTVYNVTSFKFDAGEVNWIDAQRYTTKETLLTPNYFSKKYVEATYLADPIPGRQEVRVGFRSQAYSHMVRMLDRDSNWSHELGIQTLIPCSLIFGLMGYPYILPDLIGGNAYSTPVPEAELFIRWLQASVFLPVLQFSVAPWVYKNDTIIEITRKFINLHEQYADKIIDLAKNAQQTGEPIVRPLWWIAPTDVNALTLDSEFLLGDDLLVAPVLEKGARSRDIYLPPGQWHDELRDIVRSGGTWLKNYIAELDELPYFTKIA